MLLDSVSKNYVYKGISLTLENRDFYNLSLIVWNLSNN